MSDLIRMMQLIERYDKTFKPDLLLEAMSTAAVQQKYYPNIPIDYFNQLVASDPTSKPNKIGNYSKWILNLFKTNKLKMEDLYKVKDYLAVFDRFKSKIQQKDINQFKTLPELYTAIEVFQEEPDQATSVSDYARKAKQDADKAYEDSEWLVVIPNTKEASIFYGKNTQWCTAARERNMFDDYYSRGDLYININKSTNRKYQFHFEMKNFMDEKDHEIQAPIAKTIGMSKGLLEFYKSKGKALNLLVPAKADDLVEFAYEYVRYHVVTRTEESYGVIDLNGNTILSPKYEYIEPKLIAPSTFIVRHGQEGWQLVGAGDKELSKKYYDISEKYFNKYKIFITCTSETEDNVFGVMDITGREIYPPTYTEDEAIRLATKTSTP